MAVLYSDGRDRREIDRALNEQQVSVAGKKK
jgi:hypothetical protein